MSGNTFVLTRTGNNYAVWAFDPSTPTLVTQVPTDPNAVFPVQNQLIAIGAYMLSVSPLMVDPHEQNPQIRYELFAFDPNSPTPLNQPAIQKGQWDYQKFWDYYAYRNCPGQPFISGLQLIAMTGYVLSFLPTDGRGTFSLWNFDADATAPGASDVLPNRMADQGAFPTIQAGHQLLSVGNYVLDWVPETSAFTVWSFDPQQANPLSAPAMSSGTLTGIDATHQLVVIGGMVLDWVPTTRAYTLYAFDPIGANPLSTVIQSGTLPAGFSPDTTVSSVQTAVPIDPSLATTPGTMDFMRSNIKHVVYYVLESRSFDNVVGWLYDNTSAEINWVHAEAPYLGASTSHQNLCCGVPYYQFQFESGQLSTEWNLNAPVQDPFHGTPDSIRQQWSGGYASYQAGEAADMGGFVSTNGGDSVMVSFTPNQLPIVNGLASNFAVSDGWFCSAAGGTTTNRAFLASGSAYDVTVSYEGGSEYTFFSKTQHRQSVWKLLANNGLTDWKIYYSVEWGTPGFPYTYHLFVDGQIPSVDANQSTWIQPIDSFFTDASAGSLPAFSFLEPVWFDPDGVFTSYHPTGDLIPGEVALNKIYNAIKDGPGWEQTVLVISFSKGGGIYDHVPSPRLTKAWPHDENDGFAFDAAGTRVPAIVVSPWVKPNTVFRSDNGTPFDHTSMLSTLLDWFGVPRARWGLGDRVPEAPTFETVLLESTPRSDKPLLTRSYDKTYPPTLDDEECG